MFERPHTPLHWEFRAIRFLSDARDCDIEDFLLSNGNNLLSAKPVNMKEQHLGKTLLHYAAQAGAEKIVRNLLDNGAEVDAWDHYHRTPLSWAAEYGKLHIVKILLKSGADINAVASYIFDDIKKTPLKFLEIARKCSHLDETEQYMKDHGATTEIRSVPMQGTDGLQPSARWNKKRALLLEKRQLAQQKDEKYGS